MLPSSPLARLRALEDELRELLGASVVDEALRNARVDDSGADDGDRTSPRPRARSPAAATSPDERGTATRHDGDVGTTATNIAMIVEAASAAKSERASERAQADAWDPYAAFIGIRRERGLSPRDDGARAAPSAPAAPSARGMMDASLTRNETLRLVEDLEEKVKAKPVEFSQAPSAPAEAEVIVEDVLEEDTSQRFTHQYTREDAGPVLELDTDAVPGSWANTTEEKDDVQPRARPSVSPAVKGTQLADGTSGTSVDEFASSHEGSKIGMRAETASLARAPGIAGVETVAEFKALMNAIFDEDE